MHPSIRFVCRIAIALLFVPALTLAARGEDAPKGKVEPITHALCDNMKLHNVMTAISPVSCERLRLVTFAYVGFDGRVHDDGQIVVMDATADYVLQIFTRLHEMRFPIAKARLMNDYDGNDSASTRDDNTSSFNARKATGSDHLSMHAYGLAIDLNPVQNPYATPSGNGLRYAPPAGTAYARRDNRPGMAELVIDVFADHGYVIWGGRWHNPIDYQHFQVYPTLAPRLAPMSSTQAIATFRRYVERYRACRKAAPSVPPSTCIADR